MNLFRQDLHEINKIPTHLDDFEEMGSFLMKLCYLTGPYVFQPTFIQTDDFRYVTKECFKRADNP